MICGLYYKCLTIVIYYNKTIIIKLEMIVIDYPSLGL